MLNNWFYSHPTWEVTLAVCTFLVVVSLAGLAVFHRLVKWEAREHDTSMIGLSYAIAGGIYAVVLAFVAIGVYETMDKSEGIATAEANALSSLSFDSAGLPAALGARLRQDVSRYIQIVTQSEWPSQQAYRMEDARYEAGWKQVQKISLDVVDFEPATQGQETVKLEIIGGVNELFSARRARLLAANEHLPDAVWQMLICGLVLVAIYIYMFGPHSFGMHAATTALTMISIGLIFSLIIALDYPFRGDLSVGDEAFLGVLQTVEHAGSN